VQACGEDEVRSCGEGTAGAVGSAVRGGGDAVPPCELWGLGFQLL